MRNRVVAVAAFIMWATVVLAQAQEPPEAPFVLDVVKGVALDPTTYAPGLITYGAMRLDWNSSQVFFRNERMAQQLGFK